MGRSVDRTGRRFRRCSPRVHRRHRPRRKVVGGTAKVRIEALQAELAANAETARSISPASDSPIGFNSASNEFATAVYHDVGTAEHYTTWPGYCLKALRVNSRTRLAFAPGDARYATP